MPTPPYSPSRIEISIPTRSSDGLYWGRYPNGDKPGSMLGPASIASSATGLLTTKAKLAGAASIVTAGSGALSGKSSLPRVNWHPGWYMASAGFQFTTTGISAGVQAELTALAKPNAAFVRGYRLLIKWGAIEPTQGQYMWRQPGNALDAIIAQLAAMGKVLVVTIDPSAFFVWRPNDYQVVPSYVQNNPAVYGGSPQSGIGGLWGDWSAMNGTPGGFYCAAMWRPAVYARRTAYWQDFMNYYANNPNVEALMEVETSVYPQGATDYPVHDGSYSNSALVAGLQQTFTASVAAGPKINSICQCTFLFGGGCGVNAAQNFEQWMIQNRVAPSSADTCGHTTVVAQGHLYGWGLAAYRGQGLTDSGNPACPVYSGPDYAVGGQARAMMDIQAPDQGYYGGVNGSPTGWTTQDLATALIQDYKASHAFFTYEVAQQTVNGHTSQLSAIWTNALPIMQANPLDPTYPSTYPQ